MSASKQFNEKETTTPPTIDDDAPASPFAPTRYQLALLAISFMLLIERRSNASVFPFEVTLLWGFIPPECLIWTFLILDMAVKDVAQLYGVLEGHRARQGYERS